MQEAIMQSSIGAPHSIGVAGWGLRGPCLPPKFLEHIIILCLERRFPKQNSVIRVKIKILPPQNFWAVYPRATQLGAWVHNTHAVQCISIRIRLCLYERLWTGPALAGAGPSEQLCYDAILLSQACLMKMFQQNQKDGNKVDLYAQW